MKRELDPYTVSWFMRRLREKERDHRNDAVLCDQLRDTEGAERARDAALSFGVFSDITGHDAKALVRKPTPATPRKPATKKQRRQ